MDQGRSSLRRQSEDALRVRSSMTRSRLLTPTAIRLLEAITAAGAAGLSRPLEHRELVALSELGGLVRTEVWGPPPAKTWGARRAEARRGAPPRQQVLHLTLDGRRRLDAILFGRRARQRRHVAVVPGDVEYGD